jgi:hypothetical protein
MAILRLPDKELEKIVRDIDLEHEKVVFHLGIMNNLIRMIKHAVDGPNRDPGGSDPMDEARKETKGS